jgi:transposase
MEKFMLVGCDLHDRTLLVKFSVGLEVAAKRTYSNDPEGRREMRALLKRHSQEAGATRIVFAYEASGLGFGLHDELEAQDIRCHVLAPSKMERSPKHRSNKTDEKDAIRILEILRGHYLAGNALPAVWIPDRQTRDDREVMRARLDAQDKCVALKAQIRTLLKRNGVAKPEEAGVSWTCTFRNWLEALSICDEPLAWGAREHLASLLRQLNGMEAEVRSLDQRIAKLAQQPRHVQKVEQLTQLKGVGVLSALVFLTEMGSAIRFNNRRQVGAFLGLVPSCKESGETNDRKGHITHQGPARLRYILCQAVWSRVRGDPDEKAAYERIVARNPKHKKIAVVAAMRRLAIKMWHVAKTA